MARRKKSPPGEVALALKHATEMLDGIVCVDFTDANVAAIVELGGSVLLESQGCGRANLCAEWRVRGKLRVNALLWDTFYVESRAEAARHARWHERAYAGWDDPPAPELTAEQAAALAAEAAFQAREAAMVAAAERELAAEKAAAAFRIGAAA